jgi:hypothetical protein
MITILAFFGIILLAAFITFVVGMTLRDIHKVKLAREYRKHPHARRWRERPLVSIVIDGDPTEECLRRIRHSDYNKIQIVTNGQAIDGDYILTLAPDAILERTAISRAMREFSSDHSLGSIELPVAVRPPKTTRQLFSVYRLIAAAPFTATRAGLRVALPSTSTPTLIRMETYEFSVRSHLYTAGRWIVQVVVLLTLLYVVYVATTFYRPEFLLMYLATFGLWMLWSIASYRHFSFRQKLMYFALSPVSIIAFFYWCISAPLHFRQYATLLPTRRHGATIIVIET